jgi:hypothetical protein
LKSQLDGKMNLFCGRECFKLWKAANTPPDRAQAMMSDEARAKSKTSLIALRSASDYVHSWQDRKHTDETRAKLKASSVGKHDGMLNGMYKRGHTETSRAKMSEAHSYNIINGRGFIYGSTGHVSGWHTSSKGNAGEPMFYRSSWERSMMLHLDVDESVILYEHEKLRIPYYDTIKKRRHYVPDFLISYSDGCRALVEIKPKQFLDNEKTRLKAAAARAHCEANGIGTYEILTGEILRERGIIS